MIHMAHFGLFAFVDRELDATVVNRSVHLILIVIDAVGTHFRQS